MAAVELSIGLGTRILGQRVVQSTLEVPLADTRDFPRVAPDRDRRPSDRVLLVEQEKDSHSPPDPSAQSGPSSLHSLQSRPVLRREPQPRESSFALHAPYRSNSDPDRKNFRDLYASDGAVVVSHSSHEIQRPPQTLIIVPVLTWRRGPVKRRMIAEQSKH